MFFKIAKNVVFNSLQSLFLGTDLFYLSILYLSINERLVLKFGLQLVECPSEKFTFSYFEKMWIIQIYFYEKNIWCYLECLLYFWVLKVISGWTLTFMDRSSTLFVVQITLVSTSSHTSKCSETPINSCCVPFSTEPLKISPFLFTLACT